MSDYNMYGDIGPKIVNPGEKHIACVLLVDTSGSMSTSGAIDELNRALVKFGEDLKNDSQASGFADVSVVSFNGEVKTVVPFIPARSYQAPRLTANGETAMNQAILTGLDLLEERKRLYRQLGTPYYRPWMFLMTDGYPTDDHLASEAKRRLRQAVENKKVNFFPLATGSGADVAKLKDYANGGIVMKATTAQFSEAFVWLSNSLSATVHAESGAAKVTVPPPPTGIEIER